MRCNRASAVPAMVFLALLLPAFLQAQTASLEGRALDSVTRAPVAGVRIVLENRGSGPEYHTLTGRDGRFAFHGAAPGEYNLLASKSGYVSVGIGLFDDNSSEPIPLASGETRSSMLLATDDRGDYRVYGLPPGRYYVAAVELKDFVNFRGSGADAVDAAAAPPKEHLGLQYYPGVAADGVALALRRRIDFAGVVRMEGEPNVQFKSAQLRFESFEDGDQGNAQTKADGRFTATLEPRHWSIACLNPG